MSTSEAKPVVDIDSIIEDVTVLSNFMKATKNFVVAYEFVEARNLMKKQLLCRQDDAATETGMGLLTSGRRRLEGFLRYSSTKRMGRGDEVIQSHFEREIDGREQVWYYDGEIIADLRLLLKAQADLIQEDSTRDFNKRIEGHNGLVKALEEADNKQGQRDGVRLNQLEQARQHTDADKRVTKLQKSWAPEVCTRIGKMDAIRQATKLRVRRLEQAFA